MSLAETFQADLSRYRETTLAALLSAVPQREPRATCTIRCRRTCRASGKGIRPALCLATCRAFGGDADDARPSATAIEMLHNAFLVHDDVEDESELRRGLPTMHAEHGVPHRRQRRRHADRAQRPHAARQPGAPGDAADMRVSTTSSTT